MLCDFPPCLSQTPPTLVLLFLWRGLLQPFTKRQREKEPHRESNQCIDAVNCRRQCPVFLLKVGGLTAFSASIEFRGLNQKGGGKLLESVKNWMRVPLRQDCKFHCSGLTSCSLVGKCTTNCDTEPCSVLARSLFQLDRIMWFFSFLCLHYIS